MNFFCSYLKSVLFAPLATDLGEFPAMKLPPPTLILTLTLTQNLTLTGIHFSFGDIVWTPFAVYVISEVIVLLCIYRTETLEGIHQRHLSTAVLTQHVIFYPIIDIMKKDHALYYLSLNLFLNCSSFWKNFSLHVFVKLFL